MLAVMYTCHSGVYRRGLIEEIGGSARIRVQPGLRPGAADQREDRADISHPKILYHRRIMAILRRQLLLRPNRMR